MKFHPCFPEVIMGFKEDPDAYDNFIVMVHFFEFIGTYMHWLLSISRWWRPLVMLGLQIRMLHIMNYPHLFPWILSWMLCSHQSPTSPPEVSITLSLASCCAPSSFFQSMKKTQHKYRLLASHHGLRAWPILQTIQEQGWEHDNPAVCPWWKKLAIVSLPPRDWI